MPALPTLQVEQLRKAFGEALGIVERELAVADPGEKARHCARRQRMRHRLVKAVPALDIAECLDIKLHSSRFGVAVPPFT